MYDVPGIPREEKVSFQEVRMYMSSNTVLKKHFYFIFILLLLITGCAVTPGKEYKNLYAKESDQKSEKIPHRETSKPAIVMGPSAHMADSLNYVRQHKGEGLRRVLLGSEAELMDVASKAFPTKSFTIVREPHAVLAKARDVDLSYAFYFYPSQTNNQTEVEVLLASPSHTAEQIREYQEQTLTGAFYLTVINMKLLEKGYDPNVKEKGQMLPLSYAAFEGQWNLAKKLINIGADLDLAVYELKEGASKSEQHLSEMEQYLASEYPEVVKTARDGVKTIRDNYNKYNKAIALLSQFKPRQMVQQTNVSQNITKEDLANIVKSDVDELPVMRAKPNKNAYAIVIGVEKYRQKLPKADFADNDARIMAEYLTKVMGYPEENIVTLINDRALKSDLEKYLGKWLLNNVEKDSSVFIYYSGHGAPNPKTGDAFLVPYDGDPSFIEETGYSLKRLYAKLDKLPAREIIVVLDSCFSGAGGRSVLAKGVRPLVMNMDKQVFHSDRIAILSASSGSQISSTHDKEGHGLFTYFLLKGIKEGNSELGTLYNYLKPQVERIARKTYNNEQTPGLIAPKGFLNLMLYER
ncbi:MAG: caspase family protein [Desulfobacteraceae bacterium]|nr:caspase family protein [Pseudomonadota bacterium]MCG2757938.1 caspase family protein [Desulfobacteraceae bacterium]